MEKRIEDSNEPRKRPFTGEEKKPYGRSIKSPLELCSRNLTRPMYPLMIHLCFYCQKMTSEREAFETNAGRWYFTVQMCPRCFEYNRASQEAGHDVIKRHVEMGAESEKEKIKETLYKEYMN